MEEDIMDILKSQGQCQHINSLPTHLCLPTYQDVLNSPMTLGRKDRRSLSVKQLRASHQKKFRCPISSLPLLLQSPALQE